MMEHLYIGRRAYPSSIFAVDPAAENQNVTLHAHPLSPKLLRWAYITLHYA